MKCFILFRAIIYSAIHLMGFVNGFGLARLQGFSRQTLFPLSKAGAQITELAWLATTLLFLIAIVFFLLHKNWTSLAAIDIILSQILIIIYWRDAKWGTLANVLLAIITLVSAASQRFSANISSDVQQLFAGTVPEKKIVTENMIAPLPLPVQKWLRHAGAVGRERTNYVRLKQTGLMRTKPEQKNWSKATAEQYFRTDEPAFIW